MEFFNLFYPALNAIDEALNFVTSPLVHLAFWAIACSFISMFFYKFMSDQTAINEQKVNIKALRKELLASDSEDYKEVLKLSLKNMSLALNLLRMVIVPALTSAVPVVIVIFWVSAYYNYAAPQAGQAVNVTTTPGDIHLTIKSESNASQIPDQGKVIYWPKDSDIVIFENGTDSVYQGSITHPPAGLLHKRKWWNNIIGNPAGYIRETGELESIRFELEYLKIIRAFPDSLSTWEFPFFLILAISSIAIKILFKIE